MAGRGKQSNAALFMPTKKFIMSCVVCGLIFVYLLYTWSKPGSGKVAKSGSNSLKRYHSWKTHDFTAIPQEILNKAKNAQIEERILSFDLDGQQVTVFFCEVKPAKKELPLLLLHGAGSSSQVWVRLGTMQLLAALGYRAVAVDLPGWARSKESKLRNDQFRRFLERFIEQEKLARPLIISPSMSGSYAIPYLMEPEPSSCHNRLRAFIPLAPVFTETYKDSEYHRCDIPVMIVYGTKDKTLGLTSVGNLRNMPNSEIFPMEGAGHANYEERPDEWHHLLYNFLLALEREAD